MEATVWNWRSWMGLSSPWSKSWRPKTMANFPIHLNQWHSKSKSSLIKQISPLQRSHRSKMRWKARSPRRSMQAKSTLQTLSKSRVTLTSSARCCTSRAKRSSSRPLFTSKRCPAPIHAIVLRALCRSIRLWFAAVLGKTSRRAKRQLPNSPSTKPQGTSTLIFFRTMNHPKTFLRVTMLSMPPRRKRSRKFL